MKNNSIRTVVVTGIGAALFIIIGIFVNIPIFGNTSIQLQYAVQDLFSVVFGPITGFLWVSLVMYLRTVFNMGISHGLGFLQVVL
ncbi:protein of unknown function [Streptococcus thermophilus]|uniref:ECF transporter S component n=1 Tax=Streptococcus thermophilus TaxID=1308 RepID=A0A8D6UAW5_STRTR|nr:protein of unknown function [Streptococcus thermophilus]CAD0149249.1 protein of unknown function [Streptococcus thermophilus]CAD0151113.1 protein of unknown function [Streptococcus thermophilus]